MEEKVRLLIEKHKEDKDLTSEKDYIEPGWDWSKVDLKGWKLFDLDLSNKENRADFSEAQLEGANFSIAQLEGANFSFAHLEGAVFRGAHLEGAILWEAHLKGANLLKAHLEEALLHGAHLEGANLYRAHLERADLSDANLEGANLNEVHLEGVILIGANLKGANLWEAHLEGAVFRGAHLEEANLYRAHLEGADFSNAKLINANLSYSFLEKTLFSENTQLNDVHILHADLKNSYIKRASKNMDEVVIEEREKEFDDAKEVYLSIKNYFREEGMYEVSGKYYYREMLMARKIAWENIKSFKWNKKEIIKSHKRLCREWTSWFVSKMMDLLTGYGEKPTRVVAWWFGIVSVFGAIYYLFKGIMNHPNALAYKPSPLESIYFSVVSFTTLGFGDFQPKPGVFQIVASIEAFLGALFIALFIFVFTRKMIR